MEKIVISALVTIIYCLIGKGVSKMLADAENSNSFDNSGVFIFWPIVCIIYGFKGLE